MPGRPNSGEQAFVPSERRVAVLTRDLFFRARVEATLRSLGWEPVRGEAGHAVVELFDERDVERVRTLAAAGVTVVAFGSHVGVELLRGARHAGATAVPNSQLDATLQRVFGEEV